MKKPDTTTTTTTTTTKPPASRAPDEELEEAEAVADYMEDNDGARPFGARRRRFR